MINQVVLAGRLTRDPQYGEGYMEFDLEVEHIPWSGEPESCVVCVRVENERLISVAKRFVEANRYIAIDGHIRVDQDRFLVVGRRWSFLSRDLESRCLWDPSLEVERMPVGAAGGGAMPF